MITLSTMKWPLLVRRKGQRKSRIAVFSFRIELKDPQTVKDIENLREKCKSVITNAERTSSSENRFRPKSSMNSVLTRTPSMSRNSSTTVAAAAASTQSSNVVTSRPRSCKGTRVDKKTSEKKTTTKRKPTTTNGQKPRRILKLESQDLDDNEIRLLDDDDLEEDGKNEAHFSSQSTHRLST